MSVITLANKIKVIQTGTNDLIYDKWVVYQLLTAKQQPELYVRLVKLYVK